MRWVHHFYFSNTSIWERQSSRDDSTLLKRILCIRDMLIHDRGSPHEAVNLMASWVRGSNVCLHAVYDFFRPKGQREPWASVV